MATFGLVAAITTGLAATAHAAPADRPGDPVVLKGSQAAGMLGTAPNEIVAFKWDGKKWVQIPVQIDERHTIDVRLLYPPGNHPPYVGGDEPAFDLEVYADPKTRSGADADSSFDADDELTFMGGDAGGQAPKNAAPPKGVDGRSGVKVAVSDPVGGGNAAVYLFKSTGSVDQSAGKDYVDYRFKLTGLTEGQTLKDDYGYFTSFNTEDSTVETANYKLHSFDRWMEDELRVKAGDATRADILDREVAQATKIACVRSEYTFSGRWQQDSWPGNDGSIDDEGTYVAVIDGPVRAIRSYMGANSGPYVQREHIYYADFEQNTVFLRVHVMTDLYAWTDYSEAAIGMTYRDAKNTSGFTVDGEPDPVIPTTSADIANGAYSWQQLSGPQGTVSTVVGADTDIPDANFGNYYLDDSTPDGVDEVQCGGDGKSIGASGFGILGPVTPNTDPRLGAFNNLTVKRSRYFGAPSEGPAEAEQYKERVSRPLAANAVSNPVTGSGAKPKLKLSFPGRKAKAVKGKAYRLKVRVANRGGKAARKVKVCVRGAKLRRNGNCVRIASLGAGKTRNVTVGVKVKPRAGGRKLTVRVSASSPTGNSKATKRVTVGLRR